MKNVLFIVYIKKKYVINWFDYIGCVKRIKFRSWVYYLWVYKIVVLGV